MISLADHNRIRVGISSCLLGVNVRFDGGHKKDHYLTDILGPFLEWVPVCPEIEVGMGTPREAVRLVGEPDNPSMIGSRTGKDWTKAMNSYALDRVRALEKEQLDGYVLKSKSPSCGMERVKVYAEKGMPAKKGAGLFARALLEHFPNLPVEEEGRLNDPRLRENFVTRLFAHHRWRRFRKERFSARRLMQFHAQNKFLLMAHDEQGMRQMGRLVADSKAEADIAKEYEALFFEALKKKATRRKHTNVLQHIAGYFKKEISTSDRQELKQTIEDYHQELTPLIVPMTLIRHHQRRLDIPYLRDQVYIEPHPKELMIMNHV